MSDGASQGADKIEGTIDITPTWTALLPAMLELLKSPKPDVQREALEGFRRMARAADLYNAKMIAEVPK